MRTRIGKVLKKNLFAIITLTVSIGIVLYCLFTTNGVETLAHLASRLKPEWVLIAIAAVIGCWLMEGFVLHMICVHLYPEWTYARSFSVGMTGLLYSALTPFSTGGQPMQIYSMHKMGMDTGKAGSIIAVKTLTYQVVMVIYSLVAVAAKLNFFQNNVSNFSFVTILGLLSNSVFIAFVFLFMISENTTDKIVSGVIQFLHKIKLCRHPEERYEKFTGSSKFFTMPPN